MENIKGFLAKYKYEGPAEENGIVYNSVKVYGWPKTIALGFQHFVAMSGATLAVPLLVATFFVGLGARISTALFAAGVSTLIFQLITYAKVPIFLGSSFAFLGGYAAVANMSKGIYAGMESTEKFQYASGGVVIAGLLYLILSALVVFAGKERVMKYLPPVVTGPIVMCIGISLFGSAKNSMMVNLPLAIFTIVLVVAFNVYAKDKTMLKLTPILASALIAYAVSLIAMLLGFTNADGSAIIDFSVMRGAKLIGPPIFSGPKFELNAIISMCACAMPAMVEHVGDINGISLAAKRAYQVFLARTLAGDGIGTSFAAAIGAFANTSYGECTGVVVLTKNADPRGHRMAAELAILVSFSPLLCAAIATMPTAVVGGLSAGLYTMISIVGFRNIVENSVDYQNPRNMWVSGIPVFCGIVITYTCENGNIAVPGTSVELSGLAIASILAILLNAIFNVWSKTGRELNKYQYGEDPVKDANSGIAISAEVVTSAKE